jgi:hypothetical protein
VCNELTHGVLYHEIYEPLQADRELARACGLILKPRNVVDFFLTLSGQYVHYHQLPKSLPESISYVLDQVSEQAERFKTKHGFSPCIFIDGVDLLAKRDPVAFVQLVDRAKYLANTDTLRIIFVCSEGNILPLLKTTSSTTREAQVIEVVDIPDEIAEKFLSKYVPEGIAKSIVEETGGRLIHLLQALSVYSETESMEKIRKHLVAKNVQSKINQSLQNGNYFLKVMIMEIILSRGSVFPDEVAPLLKGIDQLAKESSTVTGAINQLVKENLLRYQSNGSVAFHSRVILNYMKEYVPSMCRRLKRLY